MSDKEFITGNEACLRGALAGGAESFFGYPITPATEILEGWVKESLKNKNLNFLQTEDETAAGFAVNGAVLAGKKAFTATAGAGHILMQDPIAMAENERLPFVGIIVQRSGPSTGSVIYSQQEVNLASFGGNGDGLHIVYSASDAQEAFSLSAKIFSTAWKYFFPTFLLSDGYTGKEKITTNLPKLIKPYPSKKILKESTTAPTHIRNCFGSEKEFAKVLSRNISDYKKMIPKISECQEYRTSDATQIIIAHGSVGSAAIQAVDLLRSSGVRIGLIRPITLRPLDSSLIRKRGKKVKKVYIFESAFEQFARLVVYKVPEIAVKSVYIFKPAEGFFPEEIEKIVKEKSK